MVSLTIAASRFGRPAVMGSEGCQREVGEVPKAMKIAVIRETFADEWVAARVTNVDKADVPVAGEILTHSPDKQTVYQTAKSYLAQHPAARLFIFFTGDPLPEGVEVALALR
jgi:hypothetical protein